MQVKKINTVLDLGFRVDTVSLLKEIAENALTGNMGVLKLPINIFKNALVEVAERAIELDDPKLNILMMKLNLYEISPSEICNEIEKQIKRIKK